MNEIHGVDTDTWIVGRALTAKLAMQGYKGEALLMEMRRRLDRLTV